MRNKLIGGRYLILDRLGEGGMAAVYVARDEKLDRKVAVKLLHQHFSENPEIRQRFELEAKSISQMDHPNILKVFDYSGPHSKLLWIVTEVLKGHNLASFAKSFDKNRLNPIIAAFIARETCKALEHAHSREIIHRDIKPENIMILFNGSVKLMDFGIAKDQHNSSMTVTGTFMGSPSYMSPEQIRGRGLDHRCDLYSIGVLFYELTTGRLPFIGNTTHDVIMKIMEAKCRPAHEIDEKIPVEISKIIQKAMARDPDRRFQSARAMGREIDRYIQRLGFDESHVELERYAADRPHYETRLKTLFKTPNNVNTKSKKNNPIRTTTNRPTATPPGTVHETGQGLPQPPRGTRSTRHEQRRYQNGLAATAILPDPSPAAPNQQRRTNMHRRRPTRFSQDMVRIRVSANSAKPAMRGHVDSEWKAGSGLEIPKRRRAVPRLPKRSRPAYWIGEQQTSHRTAKSGGFQRTFGTGLLLLILFVIGSLAVDAYQKIDQHRIPIAEKSATKIAPKATKPKYTKKQTQKSSPKRRSVNPNPAIQKKKTSARVNTKSRADSNRSRNRTKAPSSKVQEMPPTNNTVATSAQTQSRPNSNSTTIQKPTDAPKFGSIDFRNTPPALIYLDGKYKCRIPCKKSALELSPGPHKLVALREGFAPYRESFVISAGDQLTITPNFAVKDEFTVVLNWVSEPVRYSARPTDGSKAIRGVLKGRKKQIKLPAGNYQLELQLGKKRQSISIFNPGNGAKRFIANPFE